MTNITTARPMPTRYEDMMPADLDALYLRLAHAIKRFESRQDSAQSEQAQPLTVTAPAPLAPPPSRRRGPYRRRAVGVTEAGHC